MSLRSIRRAAERKAAKLARKAERTTTTMTNNQTETTNNTETAAPPSAQTGNSPYSDRVAAAVAAATKLQSNLLTDAFTFTQDDLRDDDSEEEHLYNMAMKIIEKSYADSFNASYNATPKPPAPGVQQEVPQPQISAACLAANRENAKHSTGPRTNTGKSRVSMNAVKTGITAQTIVLTANEAPIYQKHVESRYTKYAPIGDDENMLVQTIIDNEWRHAQIKPLEAAIYAIGFRQFADEFADEQNPVTREALLRGHIYLHYRRDLSNLSLQDRRIRNHIEKDLAQLQALQNARVERRKTQVNYCVKLRETQEADFQPSDCGFDFSTSELEAFLSETATLYKLTNRRGDFDKFLATYRNQQKGAKAA